MGLISMNMEEKILQIPIEDIIPNRFQPRLTFDEKALQELSSSIKQHGIIQPLVLRKLGDKYEIIAGERRFKAAQMAGLTAVPAVISNIDDDKSAEVALIENIQRKNLTAIEEAKSYKNLLDRGYLTQEQLAEKLGVSQSTIANKLRLLNLADEVQDALLNEKISERHARALLALPTNEDQIKWLNKILTDRLTVRQLDIELKKFLNNNEEEDGADIPLVNLTPNIDDIKENALDINPVQGLHDIESMLKPSMPGEKTYNLSNQLDNIETLDLDDNSIQTPVTEQVKPQNKFFNFLEDEVANMNEEASIDDVFSKQPDINIDNIQNNPTNDIIKNTNNEINNIVSNEVIDSNILENNGVTTNNNDDIVDNTIDLNNIETNNIDFNNSFDNNILNSNDVLNTPVIENNQELNTSDNLNDIENNTINNNFFNFGMNQNNENNISDNVVNANDNLTNNNTIEIIPEVKNDDIFDPMSMVNTLEPDYQEKIEEAQGIDLKTAINEIRKTKDDLLNKGFNVNIDEADLGDSYTITINIIK